VVDEVANDLEGRRAGPDDHRRLQLDDLDRARAERRRRRPPTLHVPGAFLLGHDAAEVDDAPHPRGLARLARVLGRPTLDWHEVAAGPHHVHQVEDDIRALEHRAERLGAQHVRRPALDTGPFTRLEHGGAARDRAHLPAVAASAGARFEPM